MGEQPEYQPLAAGASYSAADFTVKHLAFSILLSIAIVVIPVSLFMPDVLDYDPQPQLSIRLIEVEGLEPCVSETRSPVFELSVDVDGVSERKRGPCAGGGDAMLRVSYRGIILAWGSVPRFCIDGRWLQGPSAASVASVVATAEGFVLREEMRNLIRAEQQALGSAEFDVDGELPGFGGHLHCKTYLFEGEPTEAPPPCWVQEKPRQDVWR